MSQPGSLEFYGTAAQVLPVLLLLIAFELRASVLRAAESSQSSPLAYGQVAAQVLVVALLVVGQAAALYALAEERDFGAARRAVETALFGGGLVLVLSLMEVLFRPLMSDNSQTVEIGKNLVLVAAIAWWLLVVPE
jgi:hypothetical protein